MTTTFFAPTTLLHQSSPQYPSSFNIPHFNNDSIAKNGGGGVDEKAHLRAKAHVTVDVATRGEKASIIEKEKEKEKDVKYPSLPADLDPPSLSSSTHSLAPLPAYTLEETPTLLPRARPRKPRATRPPPEPVPEILSGPVTEIFQKVIEGDSELTDEGHPPEDAFFVCDLKRVYDQYVRWQEELGPGATDDAGKPVKQIEPFFAVKCNPDPCILRLLSSLNLGFDCASQAEIDSVLSLSVSPSRIIYANPCKASSFVRHAARENVDLMTFDNADELVKVSKFHPNAKMVLRILADDSGSLCRFGTKFGADIGKARPLLKKAIELGVDVVGVSFHVGSGCTNPALFADAVRRAKYVFEVAREEGFEMKLLDVGGGFGDENFEAIAKELRNEIGRCFPIGDGVRVIAEPGRYFVTRAFELATNIIAKRDRLAGEVVQLPGSPVVPALEKVDDQLEDGEEPNVMFYINDGVYGAFNCTMFDHQIVTPHVLTLAGSFTPPSPCPSTTTSPLSPCQVWGPTCDSIDLVSSAAPLPAEELQVGDWLRWEVMGAYTICAASRFNGMKRSEVIYTIDVAGEEDGEKVEERIRELVEKAC